MVIFALVVFCFESFNPRYCVRVVVQVLIGLDWRVEAAGGALATLGHLLIVLYNRTVAFVCVAII